MAKFAVLIIVDIVRPVMMNEHRPNIEYHPAIFVWVIDIVQGIARTT